MLDFDATDNPLHGQQEARFFHGYYDSYCYPPLYVFCGQQLLCAYLRPSNIDAAQHAGAILVAGAQTAPERPQVRIVSGRLGFCRQRILNWCERAGALHRGSGAQCIGCRARGVCRTLNERRIRAQRGQTAHGR